MEQLEVDTKEVKKESVESEVKADSVEVKKGTTVGDTLQRKTNFLKKLKKSNGNIKSACKKIDINRSSYYKWIKKDKKFKKLVDDVKEGLIDDIETNLIDRIHNDKNGGILAIQWLKAKAKHRGWGDKVEHDIKDIKVKIEFV